MASGRAALAHMIPVGRSPDVEIGSADPLRETSRCFSQILSHRQLGARLSLGSRSFVVGADGLTTHDLVEFIFESQAHFDRLMGRLRLFDFAMAFAEGQMIVRGSILKAVDVFDAINAATDKPQTMAEAARLLLFRVCKAIVPAFAARFESMGHYSNDATAYELFLDSRMQYTCGRFPTGREDIEQAQVAKFELIHDHARRYVGSLKGKNHLDIGCGWGGMAAYFQHRYQMRSLGNTNCLAQKKYAEEKFGCSVVYGDFIDLRHIKERHHLITVVGMMEHLTPARRAQLLNLVRNSLHTNGIFYLQCIARPSVWIGGDAYRIAQQEVFPGHYLEPRERTEARLRDHGFEILHSMDHAHDYALTAARWVERLECNEAQVTSVIGARQYRLYLGYLAFASKLFATGRGSLVRYVTKLA